MDKKKKTYTVTVGETAKRASLEEWPKMADVAKKNGQKAYLVSNIDKRVIAEA